MLDVVRAISRELRLASRAAEHDVGQAELRALRQLADRPASSISELGERTRTDISSVSVVVSRMARDGLVERGPAEADRRIVPLRMTDRGREIVGLAPDVEATRLAHAARHLSDHGVHNLGRLLSKLAAALRDEEATDRDVAVSHSSPRR